MIIDLNDPKCNVIDLYRQFRVFLGKFGLPCSKPNFTVSSIAMWLQWLENGKEPIIITNINTIVGVSEILNKEYFTKGIELAIIWREMGLIQNVTGQKVSQGHIYRFIPKWRTHIKRKGYLK